MLTMGLPHPRHRQLHRGAYPHARRGHGRLDVFMPREDAAEFCHDCSLTAECMYFYADQGRYRDAYERRPAEST